MAEDAQEFSRLVSAVVTWFFTQNGKGLPATYRDGEFGARLWQVVAERGRLQSLVAPECAAAASSRARAGTPSGLSEEECGPLVVRVLGGVDDALLAAATKQLLKACLYPELRACRDSFREVGADGTCRRQELARVRHRVSGTHCVDCPHWVTLAPAQHAAYLKAEWHGALQELADHQAEFLPEDFRALRCWLQARVRVSPSGAQ